MKGPLKSEATLLIEIAHVFARSDVFGSGFPIMDHILNVPDPSLIPDPRNYAHAFCTEKMVSNQSVSFCA
jgi:hypothetical protein